MPWFSWFTAPVTATPPADETNPAFPPQVAVYQAGLRALARASLIASVGLLYQGSTNEEAQVTPPQPDTYTQPVQGVAQFQAGLRRYSASVRLLNPLLWAERSDDTATEFTPGVIPPVEGPAQFRRSLEDYRARVRIANDLVWTPPEDDSGPIVTTDLYIQPVQGDRSLDRGQQAFRRTARIASDLLWNEPNDGFVATEESTWTQPVQGTESLRRAQASQQRLVAGMFRLWQTSQDVSTDDTRPYLQPTPGTGGLRRAAADYRFRAGITQGLAIFAPSDRSTDDTLLPYIQPVQGARALDLAAQAFRYRTAVVAPLGWRASTDLETPISDTYIQPTPGPDVFGRTLRDYTRRVVLSLPLRETRVEAGTDVVGTQEAPYTQPVQGTMALRAAQQRMLQRVQILQGLWHQSPDEGTTPPVVTARHEDRHTLGSGAPTIVSDQAALGGTYSGGS